ncbi:hypothetical protein L9F63_000411, partial [Diploptera punctata]
TTETYIDWLYLYLAATDLFLKISIDSLMLCTAPFHILLLRAVVDHRTLSSCFKSYAHLRLGLPCDPLPVDIASPKLHVAK